MTTPLRRFVKRTLPWTIPLYERYSAIKMGAAPHKTYDTVYGFKLVGPRCQFVQDQADGTYEAREVTWFLEALRHADLFVDCGANCGLYTMLALSKGVPAIAIEPQQRNVKAIETGLRVNGFNRAMIYPLALSDHEGNATMYGFSSGSSSLIRQWNTEPTFLRRIVPTARLDNLLRFVAPRSRLLVKVDVEGHEYEALLGAAQTLARTPRPTWMVEIVDWAHPGGVHPNREKTMALFEGYSVRELSPGNFVFESRRKC